MSRYIDLFVRSDESEQDFARRLETILNLKLRRVTDRGDAVLYLYSGRYKWFDVCAGMLHRHPDYGYQLYVGRGHHDIGDRLRSNFAWWIFEQVSQHYPMIFEDSLSGISEAAEPGSPPTPRIEPLIKAGAGEMAVIFVSSQESPSAFVHSLARLLRMESHRSSHAHSPVIAVMVGEAVRLRVETHDYEDIGGLSFTSYRYCIDLDPLDAEGVYHSLEQSGRYPLLWVKNLTTVIESYQP